MKKSNRIVFLVCGLLLTLAALPVFAQKVAEGEINNKPWRDFTDSVKQKVDKGEVDLSKTFSVELEGVLTENGKLDPERSRLVKSKGDAEMIIVGKDLIEAFNDSGLFIYLRNLGVEKVNLTVAQNKSDCYFNIVSEQKMPEKASTTASGFNTLLSAVKVADETGLKKLDDVSRALINGAKVNSEGNKVALNFTFQKTFIQGLISRSLKKYESK